MQNFLAPPSENRPMEILHFYMAWYALRVNIRQWDYGGQLAQLCLGYVKLVSIVNGLEDCQTLGCEAWRLASRPPIFSTVARVPASGLAPVAVLKLYLQIIKNDLHHCFLGLSRCINSLSRHVRTMAGFLELLSSRLRKRLVEKRSTSDLPIQYSKIAITFLAHRAMRIFCC